ncbi:hypothetical protein ACNKHX_07900 [Shigella flexneri]
MQYQQEESPLAVIAGKGSGSGSRSQLGGKGPRLLGIRVVIAVVERIHRLT